MRVILDTDETARVRLCDACGAALEQFMRQHPDARMVTIYCPERQVYASFHLDEAGDVHVFGTPVPPGEFTRVLTRVIAASDAWISPAH